jgi:hypothetical protein
MKVIAVLVAALAASCGASTGAFTGDEPDAPVVPAPRASEVDGEVRYRLSPTITFRGACDASGAAGLEDGLVAVADDENNLLRIYDAVRGGAPVEVIGLGGDDEMDLEGAATIGSRIYWVSSHGRKKSGKRAPSRLKLLASDMRGAGASPRLAAAGRPYTRLLEDMIGAPALARHGLAAAAERSPIERGGLNIEGLTETPGQDHLLLGFRNPVPGGRALLVRITNPAELVEGRAAPRFGRSQELDLEGRGIRTIAHWDGAYWIAGGPAVDPGASFRLYRWDGTRQPVWIDSIAFGDLTPEAMTTVTIDGRPRLLLLSDDGTRDVHGKRCKKLRDPALKRFRGAWLEIDAG